MGIDIDWTVGCKGGLLTLLYRFGMNKWTMLMIRVPIPKKEAGRVHGSSN